jgi:hypothetical protein
MPNSRPRQYIYMYVLCRRPALGPGSMPYVAAHVRGNVGTSDALYTAVVGVVSLCVH